MGVKHVFMTSHIGRNSTTSSYSRPQHHNLPMAFAFDLSVLLRKIILDPLNSQAPGGQRRARRNQGAVAPAQAIKIITNNHLRSAKDRNSRKRRSILQAEVVPTIHDDRKMSSFYPIDGKTL